MRYYSGNNADNQAAIAMNDAEEVTKWTLEGRRLNELHGRGPHTPVCLTVFIMQQILFRPYAFVIENLARRGTLYCAASTVFDCL